jgi:hypothetical protein
LYEKWAILNLLVCKRSAGSDTDARVTDDETETLEMFTHIEGARDEVVRTRKIAELTSGVGRSLTDA